MIQAGAASRKDISLGSGSIKTLTPDDAEAIGHECPIVDSLAPLVTSTEVRTAVGARSRDILRQFLVAAVVLCLLRVRRWRRGRLGTSVLVRLLRAGPIKVGLSP